ncbi:MAG TPA: DUF934 domain-containing protein, partial [Casimicrobiaceae bacterium]
APIAELPDGVPIIVPLAAWQAQRAVFIARGETGVWLAPHDDPAALAVDVERLPLIAIDFPHFTDGRGYSLARLMRHRYGFRRELRAIGDVQRDQLYYLGQCGFDAFALPDSHDATDTLAGLRDFSDGYQASAERKARFARPTFSERVSDAGCAHA